MSELMASRKTFDGVLVQFFTDGSVTQGIHYVRGAGIAKSTDEIEANRAACWLLAEEVCVYDRDELPKAVRMARRAVRQSQQLPLIYFREGMAGVPEQKRAASAARKATRHPRGCRCPRCQRDHVGCRFPNCPTCG